MMVGMIANSVQADDKTACIWPVASCVVTRRESASTARLVDCVAGGGDDEWGAFEGDEAAAAAAQPHANGFAGSGWASFEAASQPAPVPNGETASPAPGLAAVTALEHDARHCRGVSADRALPEDLFSEPTPEPTPGAAQKSNFAEVLGGGGGNKDDFGDFADAEPVPSAPALQPDAGPAGPGSVPQPAAQQHFSVFGGPPRSPPSPPRTVGGSAGGPLFVAAFTDSQPASTTLQLAGMSGSSAAQLNGIANDSKAGRVPSLLPANSAAHSLQQEASAAETSLDDGFADFGDFAEATCDGDGASNSVVLQHTDALRQCSPSISPAKPAPKPGGSTAWSVGGWSSVPAQAAAEAAQHRRGVSRCAWSSCG